MKNQGLLDGKQVWKRGALVGKTVSAFIRFNAGGKDLFLQGTGQDRRSCPLAALEFKKAGGK